MSFSSRKTHRHARVRSIRRTSPLRLEQLEDRLVLSTFTVINTDDSGTGSLRQAIGDANTNLGGDTIQFASGVTGTITLTSGELAITDAVDLQGPGASVLAVSGNNASRVFRVTANATITGLTITGGKSDTGGGILNFNTLTVDGSTLSGNSASGSDAGGGIFNYGTLTVRNSTLSGNSAGGVGGTNGFGGGIINFNTLTVDNSTFSGNTASYQGGGIYNRSGTVIVHNSTFSGNSGWYYGGGILNFGTLAVDGSTFSGNSAVFGAGISNNVGLGSDSGTATVNNSTFSGNSASNSGGGIINGGGGTLTVDGSSLSGNLASYGGGIANGWSGNPGTATVRNSTLSSNSAGQGGGIINYGTLTVDNSTLSGNSAVDGGLYTRGTSTLNNTIVAANFGPYGSRYDIDGAIAGGSSHNLVGVGTNMSGIVHGTDGNLVGTAAAPINPMLGALQDNGGPTHTMALLPGSPAIDAGSNASIPAGVTTDQRGAGFARVDGGTVDIGAYELTVVATPPVTFLVTNLADSGTGSLRQAILDANAQVGPDIVQFASGLTGTITLTSGELAITHDALDVQGPGSGVITVSGNNASRVFRVTANAVISGLTIAGGNSTNGGGISNAYGTLTVRNSTLTGNSAAAGGGIHNAYGTLTVDGSTLAGNSASADGYDGGGGGIYNANYGTQTVVRNSTLSGNSSALFAGGGINNNNGTLTVDGTTLSGNSAKVGGGIFNGGTLTVRDSTFTGNTVGGVPFTNGDGGGIYNFRTLTVEGSTFSGNASSRDGGGISNRLNATLTMRDSTFSGNSASYQGGGIINGGTLTLDRSTVSGNWAGGYGGGIQNNGTLAVKRSTLSGNSGDQGGGISNASMLTVEGSALTGNSSGYGGGIFNGGGTATVHNSTLSGNTGTHFGGAIRNLAGSTLTVVNSTLSGNTSNVGGGIYTLGTATLSNTIVAANFHIYGSPYDIDGAIASGSSHNLIGVDTNLSGISHGTNGNRVGTAAAPINPRLGALQHNGGPTQTMTLLPGSPAIDGGANALIPAGVTTDQRGTGYARVEHGTVDIGAFELVQNRPPTANAGGPYVIDEGGSLSLNGSGSSDPDPLDTLSYTWDVNGDGTFGDASGVSPTLTWAQLVALGIDDGPRMVPNVRVRVDDGHAHVVDSPETTLEVTNVAPTVGAITAPLDPFQVGTSINTSASFTDPGTADTHTAVWNWGDTTSSAGIVAETNGSGSVTGSHSYTSAGVYTVTLTVTDDGDAHVSVYQYVVAYDQSAGFVTGGGWINSPAGADPANPTLTGKANFGFVSRYQNGNNVPTGNTEFQFKAANFHFKSTSYEWLVVSGAKARFRGVGTVNGAGGYDFELTAWDGQAPGGGGTDRFRIKIWQGNQGNGVVYDNMMGAADGADPTTALGGGSIVIHRQGSSLLAAGGPGPGTDVRLANSDLKPMLLAAINQWASAGLDAAELDVMRHATLTVADLGGPHLGLAFPESHAIQIDDDAAGHGWFVDPTPMDDPEFRKPAKGVRDRVDLVSVVAHELGHLIGLDHDGDANAVMGESLSAGLRRTPTPRADAIDLAIGQLLDDSARQQPALLFEIDRTERGRPWVRSAPADEVAEIPTHREGQPAPRGNQGSPRPSRFARGRGLSGTARPAGMIS